MIFYVEYWKTINKLDFTRAFDVPRERLLLNGIKQIIPRLRHYLKKKNVQTIARPLINKTNVNISNCDSKVEINSESYASGTRILPDTTHLDSQASNYNSTFQLIKPNFSNDNSGNKNIGEGQTNIFNPILVKATNSQIS